MDGVQSCLDFLYDINYRFKGCYIASITPRTYSSPFHSGASDSILVVRPEPERSRVLGRSGRNSHTKGRQDSNHRIKTLASNQSFLELIVYTFCLIYLGTLETQKLLKTFLSG